MHIHEPPICHILENSFPKFWWWVPGGEGCLQLKPKRQELQVKTLLLAPPPGRHAWLALIPAATEFLKDQNLWFCRQLTSDDHHISEVQDCQQMGTVQQGHHIGCTEWGPYKNKGVLVANRSQSVKSRGEIITDLQPWLVDRTEKQWSTCLGALQPRAGSGVVRIDPLRFLAGCRTRRLNQA